jgi:hypothetical protein
LYLQQGRISSALLTICCPPSSEAHTSVITLCTSGAPDVPNGCRMCTTRHRPVHAHWCRPRVYEWYWPGDAVYTCGYWPTTAHTCTLVLARVVGVVPANHCPYSVGVVLANLYMYIGAGQRCGGSTGRPLLMHIHWC